MSLDQHSEPLRDKREEASILRELNPKYERQRRYAKTEKGRRVARESAKRWNDEHRATGVKRGSPEHAAKISESVKSSWQRKKQEQETRNRLFPDERRI